MGSDWLGNARRVTRLVALGLGLAGMVACSATPPVVPVSTEIPSDYVAPSPESPSPIAAEPTSPIGAAAGCPPAGQAPQGLDPRVCGPDPVPAIRVATFGSPSGNILCDLEFIDGVRCQIFEHSFPLPPDRHYRDDGIDSDPGGWVPDGFSIEGEARAGLWLNEPLMAYFDREDGVLTTLDYGEAASNGTHACVSQEIGVSCWNVVGGHGFFVSREAYLTW